MSATAQPTGKPRRRNVHTDEAPRGFIPLGNSSIGACTGIGVVPWRNGDGRFLWRPDELEALASILEGQDGTQLAQQLRAAVPELSRCWGGARRE